jgi:magnesium chelatase family protein
LLDRVDLQVECQPVSRAELSAAEPGEASVVVRRRVDAARARQAERFKGTEIRLNAHIPAPLLRSRLRLPVSTTRVLDEAVDTGRLSARAYHRTLRIAWTLADLAEVDPPGPDQVGRALLLRRRGQQW